jgi:hypothetical protein
MKFASNNLIYLLTKFHIFQRLLAISFNFISFLYNGKRLNQFRNPNSFLNGPDPRSPNRQPTNRFPHHPWPTRQPLLTPLVFPQSPPAPLSTARATTNPADAAPRQAIPQCPTAAPMHTNRPVFWSCLAHSSLGPASAAVASSTVGRVCDAPCESRRT